MNITNVQELTHEDYENFLTLESASSVPKLSQEKCDLMKDSKFYNLLQGRAKARTSIPFCKFIIKKFNSKEKKFLINGKLCTICQEEAAFILGMRCDGDKADIEIPSVGNRFPIPEWFTKLLTDYVEKIGAFALTKSNIEIILDKIPIDNEENKNLFKKVLYFYIFNFILYPKSAVKAVIKAFPLCDDFNKIENTNWVPLIVHRLIDGVRCLRDILHSERVETKKKYIQCFSQLLESWYLWKTDELFAMNVENDEKRRAPYYFTVVPQRDENFQTSNFVRLCKFCEIDGGNGDGGNISGVNSNAGGGIDDGNAGENVEIQRPLMFDDARSRLHEAVCQSQLLCCWESCEPTYKRGNIGQFLQSLATDLGVHIEEDKYSSLFLTLCDMPEENASVIDAPHDSSFSQPVVPYCQQDNPEHEQDNPEHENPEHEQDNPEHENPEHEELEESQKIAEQQAEQKKLAEQQAEKQKLAEQQAEQEKLAEQLAEQQAEQQAEQEKLAEQLAEQQKREERKRRAEERKEKKKRETEEEINKNVVQGKRTRHKSSKYTPSRNS